MEGSNSSCPFKGTVCVIGVFIRLPLSKPDKVLSSVYVKEQQNSGCIGKGVYNFERRWIVMLFIFGISYFL